MIMKIKEVFKIIGETILENKPIYVVTDYLGEHLFSEILAEDDEDNAPTEIKNRLLNFYEIEDKEKNPEFLLQLFMELGKDSELFLSDQVNAPIIILQSLLSMNKMTTELAGKILHYPWSELNLKNHLQIQINECFEELGEFFHEVGEGYIEDKHNADIFGCWESILHDLQNERNKYTPPLG